MLQLRSRSGKPEKFGLLLKTLWSSLFGAPAFELTLHFRSRFGPLVPRFGSRLLLPLRFRALFTLPPAAMMPRGSHS